MDIKEACEVLGIQDVERVDLSVLKRAAVAKQKRYHKDNPINKKNPNEAATKYSQTIAAFKLLKTVLENNGGDMSMTKLLREETPGFTANEESLGERREGSFEDDITRTGSEARFIVRANRLVVLSEYIGTVIIALVGGYLLSKYLNQKMGFSIYNQNDRLTMLAAKFVPAAIFAVWRFKAFYRRMFTSWEVSRRFIVETTSYLVTKTVDNCDMVDVLDHKMLTMGPVTNLTFITRDKTDANIVMEFIDSEDARELRTFIAEHAQNSFTENRAAQIRGRRAPAPKPPKIDENEE